MKQPDTMRAELLRATALVSAIGLDVACVLLLGIFGGRFLDEHLHSSPWGLLGGLAAALAIGVATVYQMVTRVFR